MDILSSYLVGVDVAKMVQRQPTLLQRDVGFQVARKLLLLASYFPDDIATMIERQPALLFIDTGVLTKRIAKLQEIIKADIKGTDEDVNAMLAKAPALLSYNEDTVQQTLEDWKGLLPGCSLSRVWAKSPSLLHCDVEANIGPKVRILQKVADLSSYQGGFESSTAGANDRALTNLLSSNPAMLAYSREKFTRLLYQSERLTGFLDATDLRKTLMTDKSLADWMKRMGMDDGGRDYESWLKTRLQAAEEQVGVGVYREKYADTTTGLVGRRRTRPTKKRGGVNISHLTTLEKSNGAALANIEVALAMINDDEQLDDEELDGGWCTEET